MKPLVLFVLLPAFSLMAFPAPPPDEAPPARAELDLARKILGDPTLREVHRRSLDLLRSGLNAGSGYGEVWIRDLNTFIEAALEVTEPDRFREALLTFCKFQGPDGDVVDGYIPRERANVGYHYRVSPAAKGLLAHKNTVETDQEASLVQAVAKYIRATGDSSILEVRVEGITVLRRLEAALEYVMTHRWDKERGLVWGATTADWGDVQPESPWGVELDAQSHRAIDIYDNAMLASAVQDYLQMVGPNEASRVKWQQVLAELKRNVRENLWDASAHKFIPHLYLGESPFPRDYNERGVYYHGGTATAIEAGLLSDEEVQESLQQMRQNVKAAGAATIGLTVFPPYPKGFFKNPGMSEPYSYQNGGDWCWFGGRMVQQLALRGRVTDAYQELRPMVERVQRHGFHEWWSRDNQPRGSGQFRGSAGVLARAIEHLEEWAVAKTGAGLQRAAGDLRIKTVGVATGTGWNLFSNGAVGEYLQLPTEGAYRLVVRAWGSPCQGQWPEMALRIDGEQVRAQTVRTAQAAAYEFRLTLPAGAHILTLAFLNDAIADGQDRNLYLGGIECSSLSGDPQPSLADPADLTRDAARLEAEVLAESDGQIERLRKGNTILRLIDAQGRPLANTRVAVEQRRHAFLFGGNLYGFDRFKTAGENDEYRRRFAALFNYATLPFYWRSYEPVPGQPLYAWTDKMVDWCQENQIRMKGHPLLWAEEAGIPRWSQGQPSPERQKQRVEEIMGRYRDKIRFYEVVNEPSHLAGLEIDSPYHWARAADPNAVLIVNDYHVLADGQRPFYRLLEQAIERDVPFDGIGIQAHEPRTERFPLPRVKRILDQYARLGKGLHITEFTPASSREPITGSQVTGLWTEEAQAEYATRFYRICFAHPAVAAITWWDLCDAHSWLKGGGMLRVDLTPKPVYDGLRQLIHRQWHTQVEGTTDASGRLALRGFFGDYQVSIQEPRLSGAFQLTRSGNEEIEVRCRAN